MRQEQSSHRHQKVIVVAVFTVLCTLAAFLLFSGKAREKQSAMMERTPTGTARLLSIEPFPAIDGEMCQWVPASANTPLAAAGVQGLSAPAATPAAEARTAVDGDRAPVRVIRDTYPSYSAVAVDTNSDEVYLQDENLFGYKVFNRLDNTPPHANFTEPKRVVSGPKTKMEYNCGLYVDPKNGDVYSLTDDTAETLVVFPRDAKGNVAP